MGPENVLRCTSSLMFDFFVQNSNKIFSNICAFLAKPDIYIYHLINNTKFQKKNYFQELDVKGILTQRGMLPNSLFRWCKS